MMSGQTCSLRYLSCPSVSSMTKSEPYRSHMIWHHFSWSGSRVEWMAPGVTKEPRTLLPSSATSMTSQVRVWTEHSIRGRKSFPETAG